MRLRPRALPWTIGTLGVVLSLSVTVLPAAGAPSQTALISISPASQTQPTGAAQTYTINVSCQGTAGGQCGPNTTITIPLDTSTTPAMTDPTWRYTATSGLAGLITSGPTVIGTDLVITLDDSRFVAGFSGSIELRATPPNLITPNRTSWSMEPTLRADSIDPVTVPTPAESTATATPRVTVTKRTTDLGSVYDVDSTVRYTITARCNNASTGSLHVTTAELVDLLPDGLTYVSSTPAGGIYDPVDHTLTWSFDDSDLTTMPTGCAAGATGPTTFVVTTRAPSAVPADPRLVNTTTFSGTGPDAADPAGLTSTATADIPVQIIAEPAVGPGPGYASITKASIAPLAQPGITRGNQYVATYSGDWLPPAGSPTWRTNAAAAAFRTTVNYGLVGTYMTDLIDPLPCLDEVSGNVFSSAGHLDPPCAAPAFHTQVVEVRSEGSDTSINGLGQAYLDGWRPQAILTDGTTIDLTGTTGISATTSTADFGIPSGAVVASLRLPPHPALRNHELRLTAWGYADASLADINDGLNQLRNTATAIPQITLGDELRPVSWSASIFTVPTRPQLGISKSFGTLGAATGGTTAITIVGGVTTVDALTRDVVLTDLLPLGMTWANPVTSATMTLTRGGGRSNTTVAASVRRIGDYQGSGRELIRITVPASAIDSAGVWTITPPTNFLRVTTPVALGVYPNTDQIYLYGSRLTTIDTTCGTPTQGDGGISSAVFQNDNSMDLAGDSQLQEAYCENRASVTVRGTGAAFALTKTVQGDLDAIARGALGVGNASPGGTGTYRLRWDNVGSNTLGQPVIYDILSFVGDTGVSRGQSTVPRNSQFATPLLDVGPLPAGVTVAYSTNENPCRPEVYSPRSDSCVDDWTTAPPTDPSTVKALRFSSSRTYTSGNGFEVSFRVLVPSTDINAIAWNSAATNATDITNPSNVPLPAEPPKVGIIAPVDPIISTVTSQTTTGAYEQLADLVNISGTGGGGGSLDWRLLGPIDPVDNGCDDLDWSDAPVQESGTVAIDGDGPVLIGPIDLGAGGCYTWDHVLTGTTPERPYRASTSAGETNELTLVAPYPPSIVTTAQLEIGVGGQRTVHDRVVIDNIPTRTPVVPSPLSWTLHGPLPLTADRNCDGIDWTGAPIVDSGDLPITGNGLYDTPDIDLSTPGCYSFSSSLPATAESPAAVDPVGRPAETIAITDPQIVTQTSPDRIRLGSPSTDTVTISGTGGGSGILEWALVGPVAPRGGNCAELDWTAAAEVASGTIDIAGDGVHTTGPVAPRLPGCYSWTDRLTSGTFPSPTAVPAGAPNEVFLVDPFRPIITTTASLTVDGTSGIISDSIELTDSGLTAFDGAPAENSIRWVLEGPLAPVDGSCDGLDWSEAATHRAGALEVRGDGRFATPEIIVTEEGCYTFTEQLAATAISDSIVTEPGLPEETVLFISEPPTPDDGGGNLPYTGSQPPALVGGGLLALIAGALLLAISRRESRARR
ncbi:MAG: LPXTG cell wall anchor domain-containing protein [Acidobacteria bacterium]|nr:LPXTG cell wall anchor domain-containing protein [Acidobacteriota bacterium]